MSIKGERKADQNDSPKARITPTRLADDVAGMLRSVGPDLGNHDLLVLPPYQRAGESLYGTEDLDAVRVARNLEIDVAFLHQSEDRRYLQEYSAGGDIINFAMALSANVTSLGMTPLVNYIIVRAQQIVKDRLHPGPPNEVPARLRLAYFRRGAGGEMQLKGLDIEGSTLSITEAVHDLFNPERHAVTVEGADSTEQVE